MKNDRSTALAPAIDGESLDFRIAQRAASLPVIVADALRDAILSNRLRPGQRLVERKLAGLFGIGQPTLREALRELEAQGFVCRMPRRGTCVTVLSAAEYRENLDVRMTLEALAMERAAPHVTAEALREMEACLSEMSVAAGQADLTRFHKGDVAFHKAIWKLTGNGCLCGTLERIAFGLFAFALLAAANDGGGTVLSGAIEQHRAILDGLRTGDPAIARETFARVTARYWKEQHGVEIVHNKEFTRWDDSEAF